MTLCDTWIGPQVKESELNEPWSTYTPSLDTVSDPVNPALFTWGSLKRGRFFFFWEFVLLILFRVELFLKIDSAKCYQS